MRRPVDREAGGAIVEYVLVSVVLVLVVLAVAQVALVLHTRNVLVADAAEGARAAAARDASLGRGERVCEDLAAHVLSGTATCSASGPDADRVVTMRAAGVLPLTFVPFGRVHLDVSARAVAEPR